MRQSQRTGNRYLAALVVAFSLLFFAVGTLGPARHSRFYLWIVPLPATIAFVLGSVAWRSEPAKSTKLSTAALVLLVLVLVFSHLLPRSGR